MISWKQDLSPSQIQDVASFIISIKGSNPANAKAPQGELYKE
jgi:cytochrome c oxidase cbb3-type subunit 3